MIKKFTIYFVGGVLLIIPTIASIALFNKDTTDENAKFQRYHDYLYMAELQSLGEPYDTLIERMNKVQPYYDLYFNEIDFNKLNDENKMYFAKNYEYFKLKEKFMASKNTSQVAENGYAVSDYEKENESHILMIGKVSSFDVSKAKELKLPTIKELKKF